MSNLRQTVRNWAWLAALGLAGLTTLSAHGQEEPELLEADQAFAFKASAVDAATVAAEWTVADGYYLYRDKIAFSTDTAGYTLGSPRFPEAVIKDDEFFGKVATYKHHVRIDIPVHRDAGAPDTFNLTARSQGCNEPVGLCYPPHTQSAALTLAAAPAGAVERLGRLSQGLGLGGQAEEFLEPDQAFAFSAEATGPDSAVARWAIADGYYLYRDKIQFSLKDADGVRLGEVQLPEGELKQDEFFGRIQVFHHGLEVPLSLIREAGGATTATLEARYQGCAEAGICYPPITRQISLNLTAASGSKEIAAAQPPQPPQPALSEQDRIAASLATGETLLTIVSFLGFGLLLAFTPCVFPMIPILSGIIVGQGDAITTRRAFTLSLVYVLAMALTYTAAGVVAGLFGQNLQAAFQNPWILGSFAAVFVALSLSMFGFYDLQVPSFLQSRLTEFSNRQEGGTLLGVGVMGFLSALIVGPCVAAPLAGALIYIGQTGDAVLGGMALFALSLGMGLPLLAIGTSAGKLLPRAGTWMETIKAVFGVMLLAVAVWMLERVLPAPVTLALWAALLIVPAIYMGALEPVGDLGGWRKLWKGVGVLMLVYGVLLLIGVAAGNGDPFRPLHGLGGGGAAAHQEEHLAFKRIKSVEDLQREVQAAAAQGKPAMLDFYADWCVACKEFDKYTFSDPGVRQALAGAVLLQADVTANDAADQALLKHFKLIGPPTILFFGPDGVEKRDYRVVGFMEAEPFKAHVGEALK